MSRLAPDCRPARWWPVALWTNVHKDKGRTVVTRATATGAEDMAISLDPPGQGAIKDPGGRGQVAVELALSRSYHGPPGEPP